MHRVDATRFDTTTRARVSASLREKKNRAKADDEDGLCGEEISSLSEHWIMLKVTVRARFFPSHPSPVKEQPTKLPYESAAADAAPPGLFFHRLIPQDYSPRSVDALSVSSMFATRNDTIGKRGRIARARYRFGIRRRRRLETGGRPTTLADVPGHRSQSPSDQKDTDREKRTPGERASFSFPRPRHWREKASVASYGDRSIRDHEREIGWSTTVFAMKGRQTEKER